MNWKIVLGLLVITTLGFILRFINISPFLLYPDSYQNLLVAENLKTFGNVLGTLGPEGMLYPPFFMWTRPIYAALINLFSIFQSDPTLVARTLSFTLGVTAIPLSYFAFRKFLNSHLSFLISLLLAASYSHTIWSGFVMTETTGVFIMLLFLWSFFSGIKKNSELFAPRDILTGLLFTTTILTRYEYAIIAVPLVLYVLSISKSPIRPIITVSLTTLISLTWIILAFYPWQSVLSVITAQLTALLVRAGIIVAIATASFVVFRFLPKHYKKKISTLLPKLTIIAISSFAILLTLQILFGSQVPFYHDLSFIRNFIRHDLLISISALIGIIVMLRTPKLLHLCYFTLIAIISLTFIYHHINPEMDRYLTHILPFLLIPAAYGIVTSLHSKPAFRFPFVLLVLFVLVATLQISETTHGLRYLNDPSWYRTSYEIKVAEHVKRAFDDAQAKTFFPERSPRANNYLIIASLPEPYFYTLKLSTHSIADTPPYVYIPDSLNDRTVIIIQDMGMRDVFPNFSSFLDNNLQKYKKATFTVDETYHTANKSIKETPLVNVYEIKLEELKDKL